NTAEVQKKITALWNNKNKSRLHCGDKTAYRGRSNLQKNEQLCLALHAFNIDELHHQEARLLPERIKNTLKKYDAAYLYEQWYFGGSEVAGKTITPCTDFRWKGPKDLMNPTASVSGKYTQPEGWTDERYQLASQKLATWDVDF